MKHYPVGTWVGSLWYTIKVAHQARAYPGIVAWSGQEYFYSSLDGILVHGRVIPPPPELSLPVSIQTWVERATVSGTLLSRVRFGAYASYAM